MMPLKDGFGQTPALAAGASVIELPLAGLTFVALAFFLMRVQPTFGHLRRATRRTAHPVRPTHLAHHCLAFGIVDQILDMNQHGPPVTRYFGLVYLNLLETH